MSEHQNITYKRTGAAHVCPCCSSDTRHAPCVHVPRGRAVVADMAAVRAHTPPAGYVIVARGDAQSHGWRVYYVPAYRPGAEAAASSF